MTSTEEREPLVPIEYANSAAAGPIVVNATARLENLTLTMNVDDRTEAQVILQTIADNVSALGNTLAEAIGESIRQARGNMP